MAGCSMKVEITEDKVKELIVSYLHDITGNPSIEIGDILIEVKSRQNYRSEWEVASFRAQYNTIL